MCSVCVCLCEHVFETAGPNFANFFCVSPVAVARFSSGGIAIRHVLPVLGMTSGLAIMGPVAYFNTGAEFDVYGCLVRFINWKCYCVQL